MYRIAVTKSLEFLRSKKRKKRFAVLKSLFSSENDAAIEIPHFDHPGVLAENRERARVLFQAIEKLPESQKIAYTLNKIEDLSYGEISKVMKRSVSSIESLLHRAKSNLQNYLKNYYHS